MNQTNLREMTKELDAHRVFGQLIILGRREKEIYSYGHENIVKGRSIKRVKYTAN